VPWMSAQFTVTVGTVMHRSKLSLKKWILAIFLMVSSKKGISALQLQRQLNIASYQTAWHLCHRVRLAMTEGPLAKKLGSQSKVVEADETYIGGKPRRGDKHSDRPRRQGVTTKTPILVLVERGGKAISKPVPETKGGVPADFVRENADLSGTLMTDESNLYTKVGREFEGGHHSVKHSLDEFSRVDPAKDGGTVVAHNNTAESFFSLVKRGHIGAFHKWGTQHIHRYMAEFDFRWNRRKDTDTERMVAAIKGIEGRRLTYDTLPTGSPWQ